MYVEIRKSPIHGLGVFALELIEKDHWQYVYGMILPKDSAYAIVWDNNTFYEPYPPFRYLNHDSDPNCEVCGLEDDMSMLYIYALREIDEGEELTIDYGFDPEVDTMEILKSLDGDNSKRRKITPKILESP